MNRVIKRVLAAAAVVGMAGSPAAAARGGPQMPAFRGGWHPAAGSGAVYQFEQKGRPAMSLEVAVVGQEEGGYWVETRMSVPEEMISKILIVPGAVKRMIVKAGREPAMELPMMAGPKAPETNLQETGRLVGQERITTPAGSFSCDHYQVQEGGGVADVWVTPKVSPYGVVKMVSPDTTMVLTKVITGAKSRMTGTPQKIHLPNMAGFPGMPGTGGQDSDER